MELQEANGIPTVEPLSIVMIGGKGQVGSNVAAALRGRGHRVVVADTAADDGAADELVLDALDPQAVADAVRGADLVVHMAVVVPRTEEEQADPRRLAAAWAVNVGSVAICLEQCRRLTLPMVHISSMSVFTHYGSVPVDPDSAPDSIEPYGFSKRVAEQSCRLYAEQFGMRITSLRLAFPAADHIAPRWLRPTASTPVDLFLADGTPIRALPATQLALAVEACAYAPVGHRSLAVTASPETLAPAAQE